MERGLVSVSRRGVGVGLYARQGVAHGVLLLFSLAAILPFLWMVLGSFKSYKELTSTMTFLPETWTLDNYNQIISRVNFLNAFRNSVIVAIASTGCILLTSSAAGF